MAIFVAFAWVIQAAEFLGLIETEAQDPESRAYRLAHHGLGLLKAELTDVPLELLSSQRVRKSDPDGGNVLIEARDAIVFLHHADRKPEPIMDLGPGGGINFRLSGPQGLDVKIQARTQDGGAYDLNLTLPIRQVDSAQAHQIRGECVDLKD